MLKLKREIQNNISVLVTLADASLRTTIETTRLGWIWWVINPLVMMGIYYLFIHVILARGGDNYHLYILSGIIAWNQFSTSLIENASVIDKNAQLFKQVAIPFSIILIIPIFVQMVFALIGCFIIMIWNFSAVGVQSISIILLIFLTGMISYALSLFISVFAMYFRDLRQALQYIVRVGFFLTPVLFPAERVLLSEKIPDFLKEIYYLNPMVTMLQSFRKVLLDGVWFDGGRLFIIFVVTLCIIQVGLIWLRANSSQIAKMI